MQLVAQSQNCFARRSLSAALSAASSNCSISPRSVPTTVPAANATGCSFFSLAAVEQIGGKCLGAPPVVHRSALQPGTVFDPLQRVEDQQPIARARNSGLCGLGGDGAPVV